MPQPIPYLSFNGNCAQAMRHYAKILNGNLQTLMTFGDTPGRGDMPEDVKKLIMHAYLTWPDGGALMAGDCPPGMPYEAIQGVMLTLTYATTAEATNVFNRLAEGGEIRMPLAPTFWAKTFGMVVDRFGLSWGINGEQIPLQDYASTK
jgi:PhnB protein